MQLCILGTSHGQGEISGGGAFPSQTPAVGILAGQATGNLTYGTDRHLVGVASALLAVLRSEHIVKPWEQEQVGL